MRGGAGLRFDHATTVEERHQRACRSPTRRENCQEREHHPVGLGLSRPNHGSRALSVRGQRHARSPGEGGDAYVLGGTSESITALRIRG
jgi:hypothetical protein